MKARSVLLEPWYAVRLDLPAECVGRAMSDLERMGGAFDPPEQGKTMSTLRGSVPVAQFGDYAREFAAYTKGRGRLQLRPAGYRPCREQRPSSPRAAMTRPRHRRPGQLHLLYARRGL